MKLSIASSAAVLSAVATIVDQLSHASGGPSSRSATAPTWSPVRKAIRTASTANGSKVVNELADAMAEAASKPVQAPRTCGPWSATELLRRYDSFRSSK